MDYMTEPALNAVSEGSSVDSSKLASAAPRRNDGQSVTKRYYDLFHDFMHELTWG